MNKRYRLFFRFCIKKYDKNKDKLSVGVKLLTNEARTSQTKITEIRQKNKSDRKTDRQNSMLYSKLIIYYMKTTFRVKLVRKK